MAIDKLEFGKNLRPSTVEVMNKVNEVIDAINDSSGGAFEELKVDVDALKVSDNNQNIQIQQLQSNYTDIEPRVKANEDDLANVKITLYTPLTSNEDKE